MVFLLLFSISNHRIREISEPDNENERKSFHFENGGNNKSYYRFIDLIKSR